MAPTYNSPAIPLYRGHYRCASVPAIAASSRCRSLEVHAELWRRTQSVREARYNLCCDIPFPADALIRTKWIAFGECSLAYEIGHPIGVQFQSRGHHIEHALPRGTHWFGAPPISVRFAQAEIHKPSLTL